MLDNDLINLWSKQSEELMISCFSDMTIKRGRKNDLSYVTIQGQVNVQIT